MLNYEILAVLVNIKGIMFARYIMYVGYIIFMRFIGCTVDRFVLNFINLHICDNYLCYDK